MNTRPLRLGALIIAAALALTACSSPPASGTVTQLKYSPATTIMLTTCHQAGKTTICLPQPMYIAESWRICLRSDDDPPKTGCFSVDQITYHEYQVGDHYPRPS